MELPITIGEAVRGGGLPGCRAHPAAMTRGNVTSVSTASLIAQLLDAHATVDQTSVETLRVLLDDSTTALQMLPHLPALAPLTVATHYLAALTALARMPEIQVVALGGHYDRQHDAFIGTTCIETISSMRFDAVFMSTSAVAAGYAFHQEDRIVAVKRVMLDVAGRRHLLVDHSKLTRGALHRLAPLGRFDTVIVDSGVPAARLAALREHDTCVEVAGRTD